MSAGMSPELVAATSGLALRAEADARGVHIGRVVAQRLHESISERKGRAETLAGKTWREMPENIRTVLVMLESEADGDPRQIAKQPWGSFSASDRAAMGAAARAFQRHTKGAANLV